MTQQEKNEIESLPAKYQPIGAWGYFWMTVLFNIPIVGTICLIVLAIGAGNVNTRSFARSYFCSFLLVLIVLGIIFALGGGATILQMLQQNLPNALS